MKRFRVKPEHLKLLSRAYVSWEDCEFGAPAIDCKRPYGNSGVVTDILQILGEKTLKEGMYQFDYNGHTWYYTDDRDYDDDMEAVLETLHKETQTALQICLATQSFVPGWYVVDDYHRDWRLAQV